MSSKEVVVYVEGDSDKQLLDSIILSTELKNIEVVSIGGDYQKIKNIVPRIRASSKEGKRIALVLDADENCDKRRADTQRLIDEQGIEIYDLFFLPDDKSAGDLETVVEQMMLDGHRVIMKCFDTYEACIRQCPMDYKVPNRKARIYAYCEALSIETKSAKRNYCDRDHWDIEAPELEGLTTFLRGLAKYPL